MIRINNKNIVEIFLGSKEISAIYKQTKLVWKKKTKEEYEYILCCYSNGYWIDEYPWVDDQIWVD